MSFNNPANVTDDYFADADLAAQLGALYDDSADDAPEDSFSEDGAEDYTDSYDDAPAPGDATEDDQSSDVGEQAQQRSNRKRPSDPRMTALQKERDDLQKARAGAQRRAAELETRLRQLESERENERLQAAEMIIRERVRALPQEEQQAALAQFQQAVATHKAQAQAQQAQAHAANSERLAFAQHIEKEFGRDPQTGQPLITADAIMANAQYFQDGRQMLTFAAQQAGLLDAYGNPTPKLAAIQQAQAQAAQPRAQARPAAQQQRQRRAQRGKDNFASPRPVSQPAQEPTTLDDAADEFIRRAIAQSRRGGRR